MRIGLFLAYWPWFKGQEQIDIAVAADNAGLDSVWISEGWGQDAVSMLGAVAAQTERIAIGSGLMIIPARTPSAAAMVAATLDTISGGRFRMGIGVSGPQVCEGWYGVPFSQPLKRTREYIAIIRAALERQGPLTFDGDHYRIPLPDAPYGKPLRLLIEPVRSKIPIYLGAMGERAVAQTIEIADGWLPLMVGHEMVAEVKARRPDLDVCRVVPVSVAEDIDVARDGVREWLALYLGGMGARDKNFYFNVAVKAGHGPAAEAVQDLFLAGDRRGAASAVTKELIDTFAICATPSGLENALAEYESSGADALIALPFGDRRAVVDLLARAQ
jgi:F420-dependent oxidoreductase-like protein